MSLRTQLFQLLPWTGGLNLSVDESMIPKNQLVVADNLIFGTSGSRKKRDGIDHDWDDAAAGSDSIIGEHDFWYYDGTIMQHRIVSVSSAGAVYSYNPSGGARTTLTLSGTAWTGTLTTCSMVTFNNLLVIAVSGASNVVHKWDPKNDANVTKDLDGTPPKGSILGVHQGRLLMNDKTKRDRLHYSPPNDHTQWQGAGDSGALDLQIGDGDPVGLNGIFPTFKGDLFVGKKTKLYRVAGILPDDYSITKVSDGIGVASHNSITAVGQDDVYWVSDKGVHSLQAVQAYGDFSSADVSVDIQRTFNESIDRARLPYVWGAYLDRINSVAFTFTETSTVNRTLTDTTVNNALYLYNIPQKAWYRWYDLPCQSLIVANDSDKKRFYFGTHTTRVSKSFNDTNYDVLSDGTTTPVRLSIDTGQILLDDNPYTVKALKRFGLIYRPRGTHHLGVSLKLDNINIDPENQLEFSETGSSALLGTTFTLGTSVLGYDVVLSAYTRTVDGLCRSVKVSITEIDTDSELDIQGFFIEWEPAGTSPEVFLR